MNEYEKVYTRLMDIFSSLDFNTLEVGFRQFNFALYNQEKVYFDKYSINYDNRFLGSTAIEYEGDYIAIFYLEDPKNINIDLLAKDIIHEMYHAYQFSKAISIFPDDFNVLDYPLDSNYLSQKYHEVKRLKELFETKNFLASQAKIEDIENSKSFRQKQYPQISEYEEVIEELEGRAEYIGLKALAKINLKVFNQVLEDHIFNLIDDFELLLNPRKFHLIFGALFKVISDYQLTRDIDIKVEEKPLSNTAVIRSIENAIKTWCDDLKLKFDQAYDKSINIIEGNFKIIGYDPMNMFKLDNRIICQTFLVLKDLDKDIKINLSGPLILEDLSADNRQLKKVYLTS